MIPLRSPSAVPRLLILPLQPAQERALRGTSLGQRRRLGGHRLGGAEEHREFHGPGDDVGRTRIVAGKAQHALRIRRVEHDR